jgi:hypothetical protein
VNLADAAASLTAVAAALFLSHDLILVANTFELKQFEKNNMFSI